jgi:hypothetical protein
MLFTVGASGRAQVNVDTIGRRLVGQWVYETVNGSRLDSAFIQFHPGRDLRRGLYESYFVHVRNTANGVKRTRTVHGHGTVAATPWVWGGHE